MYNEIGGEFWRNCNNVENAASEYDNERMCFVMSGRTGIYLIIRDIIASGKNLKKIYIPTYCSHSVLQPIHDCKIQTVFYQIYPGEDGLCYDYSYEHGCECVFLMDYFGYCSLQLPEIAANEKKRGRTVIIDNTQSLLCNRDYEVMADYTVVSYRKWFASSAARVYASSGFSLSAEWKISRYYESIREKAFSMKQAYICCNKGDAIVFKNLFEDAYEQLRRDYAKYYASEKEVQIALHADLKGIKAARLANACQLTKLISSLNSPYIRLINNTVNTEDCPLNVPILVVNERQKVDLLKTLAKNRIIFPNHWHLSNLHSAGCENDVLYTSELSCICDQRYDEEDMDREFSVIRDWARSKK